MSKDKNEIRPPESGLDQLLNQKSNERHDYLKDRLQQNGRLQQDKLARLREQQIQKEKSLHQNDKSLIDIRNERENRLSGNTNRNPRHKRPRLLKHKPKLPHFMTKHIGKKARHIAMHLGLFFLPITLGISLITGLLFMGAIVNYTHQVNVIATLASPQYYAEMGSRGILGGSRKITDIPEDLIGAEPDLSVDYSHNHLMKSNSDSKLGKVGHIADGGNKYETAFKVARGCAKLLPGVKPEWVFAQEIAEFPTNWDKDRNFTGIKWASSWASWLKKGHYSTGSSAPGHGDDGQYVRSPSWAAYCRLYAKFLKGNGGRYSKAVHAKSLDEFATGLISGGWMQDSSTYRQNMHAGAAMYKKMAKNHGKYTGAPITLSGSSHKSATVNMGNSPKKIDDSDVTVTTSSLNDTDPHRTKRLKYYYSKRYANSSGDSDGGSSIKGGGASALVRNAKKFLGIPYVWGGGHSGGYGMHKDGLDCSGLVSMIFWKCGIKQGIMNTIGWEGKVHEVPRNKLQPGDLLFWGPKGGTHHIAMYLGKGKYIQEPQPGQNCEIRPISYNKFDWAGRNDAMSKYVHKQSIGGKKHGKQAETGHGSVYSQFRKAGGTPEMWKWIVMPESGGNPKATNGKYRGLFQGDVSYGWPNGSVRTQTKGAIKYAKSRYGSIAKAVAFRRSHNWW